MTVMPWLKGLRERLRGTRTRRPADMTLTRYRPVREIIENLEDRTLLAATVQFSSGLLRVLADADESVTIGEAPNFNGVSEVVLQVDGVTATNLPVGLTPTDLTSIEIITGAGANIIDLSGVTAASFTGLVSGTSTISVISGQGDDQITAAADIATSVDGGDGEDTIIGGTGDDTLGGGDGNDSITGAVGNDSIDGGDGDDIILGGDGGDTVNAGDGEDSVDGGMGDDSVRGDDGRDTLNGEAGNDTLNGGAGADVISGGAGNDVVFAGGGSDTVSGDADNDSIRGNGGNDLLSGNDGDDVVSGHGGQDTIQGGSGNDTVDGNAGDDQVEGGAGDDLVRGGAGNDLLIDEGTADVGTILTGSSSDTLLGQGGDDTLFALTGADSVNGGTGDDLIDTLQPSFINVDDVTVPEPDGGTGTMTFTVTLSTPLPVSVGVDFATIDGSATAGLDYVGRSGRLIFPPDTVSRTISITVLDDDISEGSETLLLNLTNASNANVLDGIGQGTIEDADPAAIDIFLLFDDTGSFSSVSGTVATAFPQIITDLQMMLPNADLGFGVGRFEDFDSGGGFFGNDRPFILNQPIISDSETMFLPAILAALNTSRNGPGGGASFPESAIEGLFQIATGVGFDGNGDGDTVDSGPAGLVSTQTMPGPGGDVPAYSTFMPDPTGDPNGPVLPPTLPVTMANDGVSFRPGATKFVIIATDAPFTVPDDGVDPYTGIGGVTVPSSQILAGADTTSAPAGAAGVQATIDALVMRGIQVIGLHTPFGPRSQLQGLSTLTGGLNATTGTVESNVTPGPSPDDIAPGEPLVYQINIGDPIELASAIVSGITTGTNVAPPPPPPPPLPPAPTGPQDDTIDGGPGRDTVRAAGSNDLIIGSADADSLNGGGGDDTILGGAGADTINGSIGNDVLNGQGGNDVLIGSSGDDILIWEGVGSGRDTLIGDSGSDTASLPTGDGVDQLVVDEDSEGQLRVSDGNARAIIDETINTVVIDAGTGDDQITIGDLRSVGLISLTIDGNAGDDLIDASAARPGSAKFRIVGGTGQDTILGSADEESILGGEGNDSITGGAGDDTIDGEAGADVIDGGAGDDSIRGGADDDTIDGGIGDDTIDGGLDSDIITGGDGDDLLRGSFGDDNLNGNSGRDTLQGQSGQDTLSGGSGGDLLDGGRNNDRINGQGGNDSILGNHGDDSITGGAGDDEIVGGDGDDSIDGDAGNDGITGGDGNDLLQGNGGRDVIRGDDGDDTIRGGGGGDTMLGDQGIDVLIGNGGDDLGQTGEGIDPAPTLTETIDEQFTLSIPMLAKLDAM